MASEDEKVKLKFDLANANLQSIGRAQGLYLTALLIYICLVWAMFLTGRGETQTADGLTIHLGWLDLKANAVWKVTPFITMVLTLAVAGTLNATVSSYNQVQEFGKELFGSEFGAMFEVDTHKNVIDYLALLQMVPWGKTRKPADSRGHDPFCRRLNHLIFPGLFSLSLFTSYWAIHQTASVASGRGIRVLGWTCFVLQGLFSLRPVWRWVRRLVGADRSDDVYN